MLNIRINNGTTTYNAQSDLGLYVMKYNIGEAEPKLNYVDVPYRNGALDMSTAVSAITYKNRTLTFPMMIATSAPLDAYNNVQKLFNGKECKIYVGDDTYYYTGRVKIGALSTEKTMWKFDLVMIAEPFKQAIYGSSFSSPTNFGVYNQGDVPIIPKISTNAAITLKVGNMTAVSLAAGTYTDSRFTLQVGSNVITTTGDATVTILYTCKKF